MLVQLILWAVLFYLLHKIIQFIFTPNSKPRDQEVRGQSQSKPLDLTKADVEDVEYKELPK